VSSVGVSVMTTVADELVAEEGISPMVACGCDRTGSFAGVSKMTTVAAVPGITVDIVKSMAAGVPNAVAMRGRVQECESVERLAIYDEVCARVFGGGGVYWRTAKDDVEIAVNALTM
jgi:hypothetical protein